MKKLVLSLVCLAMLPFLGCTKAESYFSKDYDFSKIDKIAVVDVLGPVGGEAAKNQIADFFYMELLQKNYKIIERSQVQILLNEQKFQASNVTTDEGMAQAGKILNVPVVLYVNIPKFREDMSMTAKMVDVQDGSILWMGSGTNSGGKTLGTITGVVAGAVIGSQVGGSGNRTEGAIAGAAVGGLAGNLLTPQKEEQARKLAAKICESLPPRL